MASLVQLVQSLKRKSVHVVVELLFIWFFVRIDLFFIFIIIHGFISLLAFLVFIDWFNRSGVSHIFLHLVQFLFGKNGGCLGIFGELLLIQKLVPHLIKLPNPVKCENDLIFIFYLPFPCPQRNNLHTNHKLLEVSGRELFFYLQGVLKLFVNRLFEVYFKLTHLHWNLFRHQTILQYFQVQFP